MEGIVSQVRFSAKERLVRLVGTSSRIVTKLPEDYRELGLIQILFPAVRIIHCTRDPMDTCLSCYMQFFKFVPYARDLESLAGVYRLYRELMDHWRKVLPDGTVFDVSYETLVDQPEETVRAICDFCGLPFEQRCMDFHKNGGLTDTASRWQVRKPIYRSSVRRSARYREFLGPLLELEDEKGDEPVRPAVE
jgi:hypothetical protein